MIQSYSYSSITKDHHKNIRRRLDGLFKSGDWNKHTPPFQTYGDLYVYPESKIFVDTFIDACSLYEGRTLEVNNLVMWCYMDYRSNYNYVKKTVGKGFHKHRMGEGNQLSGIYYLINPRNEKTIFRDCESPSPKPFTWFIHPSHLEHRPPDIKSLRRRYILGADLFY